MDHHCPWTANCISHVTFPHFTRFLFFSVTGMIYLEYFLAIRAHVLWEKRNLPSYLGPSALQLAHLFVLIVVNSVACFALSILLIRTLWCLGANTTTIEGWEIERHRALLRRARYTGGSLEGPNGSKIRIKKQEFPWDIDIWTNICQGMGSRNPLSWLWPFAASPSVESGLQFPDNGLEDPNTTWPPPDPDRMFNTPGCFGNAPAFTQSLDPEDFRRRQQADQARFRPSGGEYAVQRRVPFHLRFDGDNSAYAQNSRNRSPDEDAELDSDTYESDDEDHALQQSHPQPAVDGEGEEGWRNSEGERLADFGVDEDIEFYDEDDLPLAELLKRKKAT